MKKYLLALFLLLLILTGCGHKSENSTELNFLMLGKEPQGFNEVVEEAEKRVAPIGITGLNFEFIEDPDEFADTEYVRLLAGKDYDIVYDTTGKNFNQLKNLAIYADLTDDILNNSEYRVLKNLYPDIVWETIKKGSKGKIYGIPHNLMYGDNMNVVYYRLDFANEWGINVSSIDDLGAYLDRCILQKQDMTALSAKEKTGLTSLFVENSKALYDNDILKYNSYYIVLNPDKKSVKDIIHKIEPYQNFDAMPQSVRDNKLLLRDRAEQFIEWNKYLNPDKDRDTEPKDDFMDKKACAYVGSITDYEKLTKKLSSDEIGSIYVIPDIADMTQKRLSNLNFSSFTCIVERSEKKELALKFMCWLMGDWKNIDLFNLGIEWRDYVTDGDGYTKISEYEFNSANLTQNPKNIRLNNSIAPELREIINHYSDINNSDISPLAGFVFDKKKVARAENKISKISMSEEEKNDYKNGRDNYYKTRAGEDYEKIKEPIEEYKAELKYQIENYLKTGENVDYSEQ